MGSKRFRLKLAFVMQHAPLYAEHRPDNLVTNPVTNQSLTSSAVATFCLEGILSKDWLPSKHHHLFGLENWLSSKRKVLNNVFFNSAFARKRFFVRFGKIWWLAGWITRRECRAKTQSMHWFLSDVCKTRFDEAAETVKLAHTVNRLAGIACEEVTLRLK